MTDRTGGGDDDGIAVDPQRVILKLRDELNEALFSKIALSALVDQLLAERRPDPSTS